MQQVVIIVRWSGGDGGGCVHIHTECDDLDKLNEVLNDIAEDAEDIGDLDELAAYKYQPPEFVKLQDAINQATTYAGLAGNEYDYEDYDAI